MRGQLRHVAPVGTALVAAAFVAAAFVAASTAACGSTPRVRTPEAVLADFRSALARGDTRAAYGLFSEDAKAQLSLADFETQLRENPKEATGLQASLTKLGPTRVTAEIQKLADGRAVELVQDPESGEFRIETPLTAFYPQTTPREALLSFIRAVESARWDVLLNLMPDADRAGLSAAALGENLSQRTEELTRMVALLKVHADAPIEIVGQRATMPYGESFTARFLRENDGWKVEDPE